MYAPTARRSSSLRVKPPLRHADRPFKAVADGLRREIAEQLRDGERTAGEIAQEFNVSWPAVSRHLRILKQAGFLTERKEGRERYYAVDAGRIGRVFGGWIALYDARWALGLESLKSYVEQRNQRS